MDSWPGLEKLDVSKITKTDCLDWAARFGQTVSASSSNHTISILRAVIEIGVETGARYDNPARFIERVTERPKKLTLPEPEQFEMFVAEIESSGSGIEAAKSLGVSPATLDRLTARGLLRPCRVTHRPIYWVGELERFLKENSKPSEWSV